MSASNEECHAITITFITPFNVGFINTMAHQHIMLGECKKEEHKGESKAQGKELGCGVCYTMNGDDSTEAEFFKCCSTSAEMKCGC